MDIQRRNFFRGQLFSPVSDVRLPWLKSISAFYDNCTQCGECLSSCPENIITKGDGGYPTIDFRLGECTFCRDCTAYCLPALFDTQAKTPWHLLADVSESCLSFQCVSCRSCQDSCSYGAIKFPLQIGRVSPPEINNQLCTGCGACVLPCPTDAVRIMGNHEDSH